MKRIRLLISFIDLKFNTKIAIKYSRSTVENITYHVCMYVNTYADLERKVVTG